MLRARPDPSQSPAAASHPQGSGCFSAYFLPPLAVLMVGALLAFFALNFTPQNLTALAAGPGTPAGDATVAAAVPTSSVNSTSASLSNLGQVDQVPPPPAAPQPQAAIQLTLPNLAVEAAPAGSSQLSKVFTPQVQYWSEAISRWASAAGLDPNLAATVMQIESCGDPSATSGAGAIGLFQVMPYHFAAGDSPYDPDTNAARGLGYLSRSLRAANNDTRLAFAGYNGGISVIGRSEWTWPAETVRYAYWGSGIYADATAGLAQSSRLNEWLAAGGSGLCARAGKRLGINK